MRTKHTKPKLQKRKEKTDKNFTQFSGHDAVLVERGIEECHRALLGIKQKQKIKKLYFSAHSAFLK